MSKKVVIAGASGLIGSNLLNILLQDPHYEAVLALVRNELPLNHHKLVQLVVDFNHLDEWQGSITGHALFCCLGTTKNKTPDLGTYRKIDHDYPVKLAQLASLNGVKQYHLVSALGANRNSSNYYSRFKGETEADIQKINLETLHIYQPSLLTGNRPEKRLAERIAVAVMAVLNPFLIGRLQKFRSIAAHTVAQAMFKQSLEHKQGVFIHPSNKIKQLA
jgi:uncharacterized protein YbjT (DUF2867 family)